MSNNLPIIFYLHISGIFIMCFPTCIIFWVNPIKDSPQSNIDQNPEVFFTVSFSQSALIDLTTSALIPLDMHSNFHKKLFNANSYDLTTVVVIHSQTSYTHSIQISNCPWKVLRKMQAFGADCFIFKELEWVSDSACNFHSYNYCTVDNNFFYSDESALGIRHINLSRQSR